MSIKQKILSQCTKDHPLDFLEYENLILDGFDVCQICDEDKQFLEQFTECISLSLNNCKLTTLQNLPKMKKLTNLSFNDNFIENLPDDLSSVIPDLNSLKIANNKIRVFEDLEPLKGCKLLKKIDFADNPVSETADFVKMAREAFPSVEIVNCKDKDGKSVYSDPDDDNEFDEEGEMDMSEGEEEE